ncbi:Zn-binding domain-containing protein [Streptomyces sp. NPDC047000]|uniref:Zn-binding domain-containing protein n=1 Tax=Streptomyces sp. NPDC047000 TaxID=3155474 RepID=UPI0034097012
MELGLLPNYSLTDTITRLEATLYWSESPSDTEADGAGAEGERKERADSPGPDRVYRSETRDYERSRKLALTELAPGNSFYVNGYRHVVRALDIGSAERRGWSVWRLCPACGYVRTGNAQTDTSPCPRCGSREIADAGCVQYVLQPHRVMARDKRDDARVRDDRDERDRRSYATLTVVDIDPHQLAGGSWRHETAVFGVDFSRRAVIRTLNLGLDRQDGGSTVPLAGEEARINPFYVCTSCGGATADGRPVVDQAQHALTESGAASTRASAHHQLWCPRRRTRVADTGGGGGDGQGPGRDVPLLLAHELTTEAVRILLPASVTRARERLASFTAALFTGIAARYGGDPDHIDIAAASMPDGLDDQGGPGSDFPRRFLVVYDRLPGGTGYLHRLASPDGFRDVLLMARDVIQNCPCRAKELDGCHQCLLRRVPPSDYDRVSRVEVLSMLDDLLGADGGRWRTVPVATTGHIPLERQAESDLEVMYLETLQKWAGLPESRATADAYTTSAGTRALELRLSTGDGATVSWRVSQQRVLDGTRPDVLFERLDAPGPRLALYLDGYAYHASPEHNRLADDAGKRTRLRADGLRVFQVTYPDVKEWRRRVDDTGYAGAGPADPVWVPYDRTAQDRARAYYAATRGGLPGELPETVWVNPAELLLAYLRAPDARVWHHRAEAAVAGLVGTPGARDTAVAPGAVGPAVEAALRGDPSGGPKGPLRVLAVTDASGCRLVLAADVRRRPPVWTALTVLDDRASAVADEKRHQRRWRAWLYWSNLIQFLEHGGGDGAQLTTTLLDGFTADVLTVTGGAGWLSSTGLAAASRTAPVPASEPGPVSPAATALPAVPAGASEEAPRPGTAVPERDGAWDAVLRYLDPDEPGLAELAQALADAGVPAPEDGFELDDHGWLAELAWPDARIGVVLAPHAVDEGPDEPDHEARDRDRAFAAAGWEVRPAAEWDAGELAARIRSEENKKDEREENGEPGR